MKERVKEQDEQVTCKRELKTLEKPGKLLCSSSHPHLKRELLKAHSPGSGHVENEGSVRPEIGPRVVDTG